MRLFKEEIIGLDDEMGWECEIGSQCSCIADTHRRHSEWGLFVLLKDLSLIVH